MHRIIDVCWLDMLSIVDDNCFASWARFDGNKCADDITTLQVRGSEKSASSTEYRADREEPVGNDGECRMELILRPRIYTPPLTAAARQNPCAISPVPP